MYFSSLSSMTNIFPKLRPNPLGGERMGNVGKSAEASPASAAGDGPSFRLSAADPADPMVAARSVATATYWKRLPFSGQWYVPP